MTKGDYGRSPGGDKLDTYQAFADIVDHFHDTPTHRRRERILVLTALLIVLVIVLVCIVWVGVAK